MVALVGGSGFIGTRLCRRLSRASNDFRLLDKQMSNEFAHLCSIVDVRDKEVLRRELKGSKVIINLAAEHRDDVTPKSLYDDVNVGGAQNICEAAESNNIDTIIFISSVAVYGFAPLDTDENGEINYFNDYGRTKYEAELVYKKWQAKQPQKRKLTIIRPTVIFGEENRGNVYNLFKQIINGKFIMIGNGKNCKSMAYVENIAAFIEYSLNFDSGVHIYNYIDKPDFDMNTLVKKTYKFLGKSETIKIRIPFIFGYCIGIIFDMVSFFTKRKFSISAIRVKKFCSNSVYKTSVSKTGFNPPVKIDDALSNTLRYEFM
jgi:nucleoside-diphosphate-sugar epimerase